MEWLSRLRSGRGHDPFAAVVVEVFEQAGWTVEVDPTGSTVAVPGGGHLTLQPLRELCAGTPRRSWHGLVAEQVLPFVASIDGLPDLGDWAAVQPLLRTRLRHSGDAVDEFVLRRELAEGLLETVVVDTPLTCVGLDRGLLDTWPVTQDAVFAEARSQVHRREPVAVESVDLGGRVLHRLVPDPDVDSYYVASHLPRVADLVPVGPLGLAVGVPDQRCVVALPLTAPVAPGIRAVFHATQERYDPQGGAVSPDVYWWREGALRRIARAPHDDEGLTMVWTQDYLRLNGLVER